MADVMPGAPGPASKVDGGIDVGRMLMVNQRVECGTTTTTAAAAAAGTTTRATRVV